jgi:hypothetical protein
MQICIPSHAFDYLKLSEKSATATDLLTDAKLKLTLKRDGAVPVELQPNSAVILKFRA